MRVTAVNTSAGSTAIARGPGPACRRSCPSASTTRPSTRQALFPALGAPDPRAGRAGMRGRLMHAPCATAKRYALLRCARGRGGSVGPRGCRGGCRGRRRSRAGRRERAARAAASRLRWGDAGTHAASARPLLRTARQHPRVRCLSSTPSRPAITRITGSPLDRRPGHMIKLRARAVVLRRVHSNSRRCFATTICPA